MTEASWDKFFKYFQFSELSWISDRFFCRAPAEGEGDCSISVESGYAICQEWLHHRWGDCSRGLEVLELKPDVARDAIMRAGVDLSAAKWELPDVVAFVYHYQASHLMTERSAGFVMEDLIGSKNMFKVYDGNGEGLKARQLWAILKDMGYEFPTVEEQMHLIELVKEADTDRSGALNFMEFLQLLRKLIDHDKVDSRKREHRLITSSGISLEECEEWLHVFQAKAGDEGEAIDIPEMRALFETIDLRWDVPGSRQMMDWLREVDENSDGQIDFGEFCCLVQKMWDHDFAGIRGRAKEALRQTPPKVAVTKDEKDEDAESTRPTSVEASPRPKRDTKRRTSWGALLAETTARELDPRSPKGQEMVRKFEEALAHGRRKSATGGPGFAADRWIGA